MKKNVAKFIGTFILVFCGTGAIVIDEHTHGQVSHVGVAITFGLVVMAMIYSIGNVSGAHLNPAVSIAFVLAKKFPLNCLLPYVVSQVTGAVVASFVLKLLFPHNVHLGATLPSGSDMQSFVFECILTFILMLVIINVATGSKEQGMFAGLAIGSVVLFEAMFAGPISGASMNPARSLGPAVASGNFAHLWLYLLAPVMGAVMAIICWNYIFKQKYE